MISRLRKAFAGTLLMLAMVMLVSGAAYALDTTKAVTLKKEGNESFLYYEGTDTKVTGVTGLKRLPAKSKDYYYFKNNNGSVYAKSFIKTKKGYYYAGANGKLVSGWVVSSKGKRYFNPKNLLMLRAGFKKVGTNKKYSYFDKNGYVITGFKKIGKYTYYFDPKTTIAKTGWLKVDKKQYYFDKYGHMVTGIATIGNGTYYFKANGQRLNRLVLYKGKIYYFAPTMKTGWITWGGARYYFRPSGKAKGQAVIGWLKIGGKQYYFGSNAKMVKGWLTIGSQKFYFNPQTGARTYGKVTIDGKTYDFGTKGYISMGTSGAWSIQVNQGTQIVTIFRGGDPIKAFQCSTGLNNATPDGTRYIGCKHRGWTLMGPSYGQYCEHLVTSGPFPNHGSDYLFHSIPCSSPNNGTMSTSGYNNLGHYASHGCVRLAVPEAKYIYENCPIGTPVKIFHGSSKDDPIPAKKYGVTYDTYDPEDPLPKGTAFPAA